MTARVIQFRPRGVAGPSVQPGRAAPDGAVAVEWDFVQGVHTAVCGRCAESMTAVRLDQAHDWAESHRCDPELAALLAEITGGTAA